MSQMLQSVFVGGSAELRTSYTDKAGVASAPASLSYRIIKPSTGTVVRAATALTPAEVVAIPLKPADHALSIGATQERRRVIVTATYGIDDVLVGVYDYLVVSTGCQPPS